MSTWHRVRCYKGSWPAPCAAALPRPQLAELKRHSHTGRLCERTSGFCMHIRAWYPRILVPSHATHRHTHAHKHNTHPEHSWSCKMDFNTGHCNEMMPATHIIPLQANSPEVCVFTALKGVLAAICIVNNLFPVRHYGKLVVLHIP